MFKTHRAADASGEKADALNPNGGGERWRQNKGNTKREENSPGKAKAIARETVSPKRGGTAPRVTRTADLDGTACTYGGAWPHFHPKLTDRGVSCDSKEHGYGQYPRTTQQGAKGGHAAPAKIAEDASVGHEQDRATRKKASAVWMSQAGIGENSHEHYLCEFGAA